MKKKLLFFLGIVLLGIGPIVAQTPLAFTVDNNDGKAIRYHVVDTALHKVEVTNPDFGEENYSGVINIPGHVLYEGKSYEVVKIGDYAFMSSRISSITIPNTVECIGVSSFMSCGLDSVMIPNSVVSIGRDAFMMCNSLLAVTMGDGVISVGRRAFAACVDLDSIRFSESLDTIKAMVCASCPELLHVTIPNSVSVVEDSAFMGCMRMRSLTIGSGVVEMGKCVTEGCSTVSKLVVKATVPPMIGDSTFVSINEGWVNVFVPCGELESYRSDEKWSVFSNILCETEVHLEVLSNNEYWGTTSGSGDYYVGKLVEMTATAEWGYHFVGWQDGDTVNPRTIEVTEVDTVYVAMFESDEPEGIDDVEEMDGLRIYPNPTSGVITIEAEGVERVVVMNMVGEKVAEFRGESMIDLSELSSGMYMLRITTSEGMVTRRVIKK